MTVPQAYLRKWQTTIATLASLREGSEVTLSALVRADRLTVLLVAGSETQPGSPVHPEAPDWVAARSGRPFIQRGDHVISIVQPVEVRPARDSGPALRAPRAPESPWLAQDGYCALPLLWPDRSVYGVLAARAPRPDMDADAWVNVIQQMRLLIQGDLRTIHYVREVEATKEQLEDRIQARNQELLELNARLSDELDNSRKLSEAMRQLTTSGDGAYGQAYFRHMVKQLAELFGGDVALVATLSSDRPGWATTLAAYTGGTWVDDVSYELAGTPCADLLTRGHVVVHTGLAEKYPAITKIAPGADSYVGVLLRDTQGDPLGIVLVLSQHEMPDSELALQLMDLMATRTSTEIQRMRAEQHLRRLSEVDELTGLLNRASLLTRLGEALAEAGRSGGSLAVLFIDLDNFKTINDSLGHDVGDELLTLVSERIAGCFRDSDVVARLGGDEFAAVVRVEDAERLTALCEQLSLRFRQPFMCRNQELYLSVSIGVSQYPENGSDTQTLLRRADIAMYQAKERGRNQRQFYTQTLADRLEQDLRMTTRLRRALMERQFEVYYQPKVDIVTREILGVEALVRWFDPELGEIVPDAFIPLAQRTGISEDLSDFVVTLVARDLRAWRAAGLRMPSTAVNVSPGQMRDSGFADRMAAAMEAHSLSPSILGIELTEDALLEHGDAAISTLEALAAHGFRISIDDFGTGHFSLAGLRTMPIHEVKIDRSFIRGIVEHSNDRAIASAIVGLASSLGLEVVAEGVEREEQVAVLAELGCTTAQGHLFHKAMPEKQLRQLLTPANST